MGIDNLVKRLQNIMRQDSGVDGDAQRIGQIVWILFLKVYDAKEELWELYDDNYESIIPEELRWREWAVDNKDGEALTGEALLEFINDKLFPTLKTLEIDETTPRRSTIVKEVFIDAYNYMKNGTLLRQVINIIDEIEFTEYDERHSFNDIYETILKDLQSAGKSGEFYTPRPVTDFIAEMLNEILTKEQTTTVLLETMSGKGSEVGRNFEELKAIIDKVKLKDKLGVCLDTCHIWDGGYDVVNNFDGVLDEFDKIIGLEKLKAIHLNDSKNDLASHKDRHEKIGEGKIGLDAISKIINNDRIKDLPFYLETPNEIDGYEKEIELLKKRRI